MPALETPLWAPQYPEITNTHKFMTQVNEKYGLKLSSYYELWEWSVSSSAAFWDLVWDFTGVIGDKGSAKAVDESVPMDQIPAWFPDAKLNWAENMLRSRSREKIALIQAVDPSPGDLDPPTLQITYGELCDVVHSIVKALRKLGIQPGEVIASYSSNCIENVAAALAATAIGAIWVSAAADFGPDGVLDRFEQVRPSVIFSVESWRYNGKRISHFDNLRAVLTGLSKRSVTPKLVVIIPLNGTELLGALDASWMSWADFVASDNMIEGTKEIDFWRGGFDHPLWILFSSGTTGKPKAIVHRAGGMLLQSLKEFSICADLNESDVFFYYTTTGWMMWNFLVSGLSSGCTLVLYDGGPLKYPSYLWKLCDKLKMTIFGTSAKYLEQLAKTYIPRQHHSLSSLRMIMSTGSPLAPGQFDFVYRDITSHALLASITGGTDICSLFAGVNTMLPVYRGEIQCRMLGMSIYAYSDDGKRLPLEASGELVCDVAFPCQPIGFWPLPGCGPEDEVNAAQVRYADAYYATIKGVWYHGDHVLITSSKSANGGGVVMLGRSDGVLNPGGIRFGSAEIYEVLDQCFSASAPNPHNKLEDYVVVGQKISNGADERVLLFVKLVDGEKLDSRLEKQIRSEIASRRSRRHIPDKIITVHDIPYTLNGKKVEVPVKKIMNGAKKDTLNLATLRNPKCLDEYERLAVVLAPGSKL